MGPELDRGRVSSNKKLILPPFCFSGRWHTFGALFTCLKEIKCGHDWSENLQCAKHIAILFKRDESENSWWKWGHYTFRNWFRTIFQLRMLWNKLSIQPRGCQMVSGSGFDLRQWMSVWIGSWDQGKAWDILSRLFSFTEFWRRAPLSWSWIRMCFHHEKCICLVLTTKEKEREAKIPLKSLQLAESY